MSLEQKDIELTESIIRRTCDDLLISFERSLDRLAERLDGAETRIYSRFADLEETNDDMRQAIVDVFDSIREDIRELNRMEV